MVVHKVIIVSVRVLYVGFSISLVFGFRVFRFLGFQVFRFSGFQVFRTGRDGTGQDAELDNFYQISFNTIRDIQNFSIYFWLIYQIILLITYIMFILH